MSFLEKFTGPKLHETNADAFKALETKMREVAQTAGTEADKISDRDIKQAAFHYALMAERAGAPVTTEVIASMNSEQEMQLVEALGLRINNRPDIAPAVHVSDQSGVVETVPTMKDAMEMTSQERVNDDVRPL